MNQVSIGATWAKIYKLRDKLFSVDVLRCADDRGLLFIPVFTQPKQFRTSISRFNGKWWWNSKIWGGNFTKKMRLQNSLEIQSPWNPRSWSGDDYNLKKVVYTYTTLKTSVGKLTNRGISILPFEFRIAKRQSKNKRYQIPNVLTSPSHSKRITPYTESRT